MQKKSAAELSELINDHIAHLQMIGATWSGDILRQLKDAQKELLEYFLNTQKHFGAIGIDAGTNKKALCLIPKGTKVNNFGFYTTFNGVKWLLIQFTLNGVRYTGFSSSVYLKK